jgi:rRNA maturation endonuclease Nob1
MSAALFHLDGAWVAACPTCGHQLARHRSQRRAERAARRRPCPVCRQAG